MAAKLFTKSACGEFPKKRFMVSPAFRLKGNSNGIYVAQKRKARENSEVFAVPPPSCLEFKIPAVAKSGLERGTLKVLARSWRI
jgi:hypothetical protein